MQLKTILSALAFITATCVSAQSNIYIKPMVGYGLSNISFLGKYSKGAPKMGYAPSSSAGIYLGVGNGKWIFETGVRYLSTGYKLADQKISGGAIEQRKILGTGDYIHRYDHIGIPLAVLRSIRLSEKFSLQPGINLLISYNLGRNTRFSPELKPGYYTSGTRFYNTHTSMCTFSGASIHAGYSINNSITIIGGPGVQYALSDLGGDYSREQHNYAFTFDLGVKWSFKKKKTAESK